MTEQEQMSAENIKIKLIGRKVITGKIKLVSGLHIGGNKDTLEIGGMDNPVIKDNYGWPYIPGSSLKGKMRSLLEHYLGHKGSQTSSVIEENEPCFPVTRIFGLSITSANYFGGPTRLMIRDAHISNHYINKELKGKGQRSILEEKTETAIDRIKGTALYGSLRKSERVSPGVVFDFEMVYKVYDVNGDSDTDEKYFKDYIPLCLALLQKDALGGSGSRGYGEISFDELEFEEVKLPINNTIEDKDKNKEPLSLPRV